MTSYAFSLTIGLLLILLHDASGTFQVNKSCECGNSKASFSMRIVSGMKATPHIYPWIVPILRRGKIHCGGTIINNRYILTAGHCVRWANHSELRVALGVHDLEETAEYKIVEIQQVILHENFSSSPIRDLNDLSLLKLKEPIVFNQNVQATCLPIKETNYTDENVIVVGWGRMAMRGSTSNVLHETTLKVISFSECQKAPFASQLTESMICAYKENTDACQGDSGGPLLRRRKDERYELIGVVSWGRGCAQKGMPGVYVKNIDYIDWIKDNSRDGVFCNNPSELDH